MGELMRISEIGRDTPITIPTTEGAIAMSVADVVRWIAPNAPPQEAIKFLLTCRAARVNPFLGEAHLVDYAGKYATIIDKSGWLRQAEDNVAFDGFEAGIVVRKVLGKKTTPDGKPIKGADGKDVLDLGDLEEHDGACLPAGYQLVGGWARVYRKGRTRPIIAKVSLNEYRKSSPNWQNMPATMIRKVALVQALREGKFLASGSYDRDEMPDIDDDAFATATEAAQPAAVAAPVREAIDVEFRAIPTHQLDVRLATELEAAIQAVGMTDYERDRVLEKRGVRSIAELSQHDARDLLTKLRQIIDRENAGRIMLPDPEPAEVARVVTGGYRRGPNGHMLLTPANCTHDPESELNCPVCDRGLAVCAICGAAESQLDSPCPGPTISDGDALDAESYEVPAVARRS